MLRTIRHFTLVFLLIPSLSRAQVKIAELPGAPGAFTAAASLIFQATGNVAYATNPGSGLVQKFRPSTGEVLSSVQIAPGVGPATLSFDQKTLVVLGVTTQKLYFVSTDAMKIRQEAGYPGSGFTAQNNMIITQGGSKVFIADAGRNQIAVFNLLDGSVDRFLNVGINPGSLNLLPNGKQAAVLCSGKQTGDLESIYLIDTLTVAVIDCRSLTGENTEPFNNIQFTATGSHLYIPVYNRDRLLTYDLTSGILASRSSYGKGPTKVQSSPDGRWLAVLNSTSKSIALLMLPEALPGKEIALSDLDFSVDSTVAFSADNKTLYVPSQSTGEVLFYDMTSFSVKKRLKTGEKPLALGLNADGSILAALETGSNRASLIALSPTPIYIPHLVQNSTEFSGLAIANFGAEGANVSLTARDNKGVLLQGTTNPRLLTIQSNQQTSLILSQIFGFDAQDNLEGWIEAFTLGPAVSTLYLSGNILQTQLDGFLANATVGKLLGFSRITEQVSKFGGQTSTEIMLINPSETTADLTLRLYGTNLEGPGSLLSHVTKTLAGGSRLTGRVSQLIPNAAYPIDKGYLEVTSSVALQGLEIVRIGDSSAMIPAKVRGLPDTEFVATQFASGGAGVLDTPIFTSMSFCNVATTPLTITAEVTGDDGKPIPTGAAPVVRTIQPNETLLATTGDPLFGFPDPRTDPILNIGTLRVTADQPGLIGDVLTGDAQRGDYLTTVTLQLKSSKSFSFTHFAEGSFGIPPKGLYTGLALYNPNRDFTEVTVEAFSPQNVLLGKTTFQLDAKKRVSRTISQLIPAIKQQNAGTLRVTSILPVYAFEVFGSTASEFLTAVPPIIAP